MKRLLPLLLALIVTNAYAVSVTQAVTGSWVTSTTSATVTITPSSSSDAIVIGSVSYQGGTSYEISTLVASTGTCTSGLTKEGVALSSGPQTSSELWICTSVGTTSAVTFTATYAGSINKQLRAWEVSGGTVDKVGTNTTGSTATPSVTASGANASTTDVVIAIGVMGYSGTVTSFSSPPSGGSGTWTDTGVNGGWGVSYVYNDGGYKVTTASETSSANWTVMDGSLSSDWAAVILTMSPSGGGSCTHAGITSAGASATPNGTTGSYVGKTGSFVTPNCSSVNYWQPSVGNFGAT